MASPSSIWKDLSWELNTVCFQVVADVIIIMPYYHFTCANSITHTHILAVRVHLPGNSFFHSNLNKNIVKLHMRKTPCNFQFDQARMKMVVSSFPIKNRRFLSFNFKCMNLIRKSYHKIIILIEMKFVWQKKYERKKQSFAFW